MSPRSVHEHDPDIGQESEGEGLIDAFKLGRVMQEFADTNEAGAYLVAEANTKLQEAINLWLREDDPGSEAARGAHFRARVAIELLTVIESAVTSGRKAEVALSEMEASGTPS